MLVPLALLAAVSAPPHPDAKSACAAMNVSMLIEVMHGFGEIAGYSRNSGCGKSGVMEHRERNGTSKGPEIPGCVTIATGCVTIAKQVGWCSPSVYSTDVCIFIFLFSLPFLRLRVRSENLQVGQRPARVWRWFSSWEVDPMVS